MSATVFLPLTRGRVAEIDFDDLPLVAGFRWQAHQTKSGTWRVKRGVYDAHSQRTRNEYLARRILNAPEGVPVDHKDGNPFNNRRYNLRLAPDGANQKAFRRKSGRAKSRFRGVRRHVQNKYWQAGITVQGREIYLGVFASEEDAARAYDVAAKQHFGEFAHLNFP